jgi:hypothetical protein
MHSYWDVIDNFLIPQMFRTTASLKQKNLDTQRKPYFLLESHTVQRIRRKNDFVSERKKERDKRKWIKGCKFEKHYQLKAVTKVTLLIAVTIRTVWSSIAVIVFRQWPSTHRHQPKQHPPPPSTRKWWNTCHSIFTHPYSDVNCVNTSVNVISIRTVAHTWINAMSITWNQRSDHHTSQSSSAPGINAGLVFTASTRDIKAVIGVVWH